MGKTSIEWTEESVNPLRARNRATGKVGHYCEKIATGCKNCYSSALQPRFGLFPFLHENREKVDLFLDEEVLRKVLTKRKPTTYFWCSMTDLFLEHYPDEWIDRCFATMALRPQDTHIVLTKRGKRMREYFGEMRPYSARVLAIRQATAQYLFFVEDKTSAIRFPLPNVILGVSGSTQADIDELVPELLRTPAACRLLSLEPQVEDVDLLRYLQPYWTPRNGADSPPWLDWVIQGGESGTNARLFDLAWADKIRGQCEASGCRYFLKQIGSNPVDAHRPRAVDWKLGKVGGVPLSDTKGGNPEDWPERFRVRQMPEVAARRTG